MSQYVVVSQFRPHNDSLTNITSHQPSDLCGLLQPHRPSQHLRSSSRNLLDVPRMRKLFCTAQICTYLYIYLEHILISFPYNITGHLNENCRYSSSATATRRHSHPFLRAPPSDQWPVETSSSLAPDFAWVTVHSPSPVLRRGTVCRLTFELHQHCLHLKIGLRLICFCSHIMSHLNQLNSSGVCCTALL